MDINEDTHYKDYIRARNYKQRSIDAVYQRLTKYFQYINKTPTDSILEAEDDEDQRLRMKNRRLKTYLTDYLTYLIQNNYSENYIKTSLGTVRSFYREFDIELPRQTIRLHTPHQFSTDDIIQHTHIRDVLSVADNKWKAIITTMASSGMGSAEMRSLTLDDLKNGLTETGVKPSTSIGEIRAKVEKNNPSSIIWKIRRVKTGTPYFCFSTPESLSFILTYLSKNRQHKRKYLFTTNQGKQLTPDMVTYHFSKLNRLAGLGYVDGKRFFHSHGLRTFFASTLYKAGLPQLTIDFFLGHRIDPVSNAYFKADINKLQQDYLKIIPSITFTEPIKVRVVTDERLAKLEEKIAEQAEWIEILKRKDRLPRP